MAMRSASAKLFAGRLRAAEEVAGGNHCGLSGRGMSAILFGDEASRVAARPAILRAATGAAANGGRRFFSCGGQVRLPCGGNTTTRGLIFPEKLKREIVEEASEYLPGGMEKCPHVKIFKLQMEAKSEKAISALKSEYEAKLAGQKGELEAKLDLAAAHIRLEFEMKLRDAQNEWKLDLSGLRSFLRKVEDAVKSVDAKCVALADKLRIQSVQYNVIKIIGGVLTLAGGVLVTYDKLKEELDAIPCPFCDSHLARTGGIE